MVMATAWQQPGYPVYHKCSDYVLYLNRHVFYFSVVALVTVYIRWVNYNTRVIQNVYLKSAGLF